ncbi:uncharacterized protein LOC135221750 isoform X2 [Macrobrachium nipponense]|uniref:uncharacterized protein LOC135221750 isoform X2 n=1 Tax=Macrobrachium nipponense TaxID=159736 RepID=UPI0030C88006
MTCTVLASAVPVDHPRSSARKLSSSQASASRPGTPIVTPRTNTPSASRPPSRSVSRLTTFGTLPAEQQLEEVGEEEEEECQENRNKQPQQQQQHHHRHHPRLARSISQECAEEIESSEELLSGASLSSISESDTFPPSSAPQTPPTGNPNSEDGERFGLSGTCGRASCVRGFKSLSRAVTTASASYRARHSKYCNCSSSHLLNEVAMVDAQVIYASSHDPNFPPAAVMDGRRDTFWVSNGLYPQFLVVSLPGLTSIDNVNIIAYNVRKISVARSIKKQPTDFEEIAQEELHHEEGKLQETPILSQNVSAIFLRITIEEAYDHFCAVHRLSVTGTVSNPNPSSASLPPSKPKVNTEAPSVVPPPKKDSTMAIKQVPTYQRPHEIEQGSPSISSINEAPAVEDTTWLLRSKVAGDRAAKADDVISMVGDRAARTDDVTSMVEEIGGDDEDADDVFPLEQSPTDIFPEGKRSNIIKVAEGDSDDMDEF